MKSVKKQYLKHQFFHVLFKFETDIFKNCKPAHSFEK